MTSLADRLRNLLNVRTGVQFSAPRWIVLARIEDDRSDFPASRQITHSMVDGLIESFDPARRQVPIICAQGQDIPAHWADPLPPVGDVVELSRDYISLWGKVRSIIDPALDLPRLDLCVSSGFDQRSVAFRSQSNETGGRPVLFHLALLGGEQPGISNMPTLSDHGLGLDDTQLTALRSRSTEPGSISTFLMSGTPVDREWAPYGGVESFRTLADQLHYQELSPPNSEEPCLVEETSMADDSVLTQLTALTSSIETLVERLVPPASDDDDSAPGGDEDRNTGPTDPGTETPPPTLPPTTPTQDRTAPPAETPAQLTQRVAGAAHRAAGFGLLPAAAAQAQARTALAGGTAAVDAFESLVDTMAQARTGDLFQEVHTQGGPVDVNLSASQFRVLSNPSIGCNETRLAYLAQAIEGARAEQPNAERIAPKVMERHARRALRGHVR